MRFFYHMLYRHFRAPWEIGARSELVSLVESGQIPAGRAIDLGCGTGANSIFLAQNGFDVTGVDFAPAAIEKARLKAEHCGLKVNFLVDDLTHLEKVSGTYDLLVDYGTLDDLRPRGRKRYLDNVLPLTHVGSRFLLFAFEWQRHWWERINYFSMALDMGEVEQRFSPYFHIEEIDRHASPTGFIRGDATYLMTRNATQLML